MYYILLLWFRFREKVGSYIYEKLGRNGLIVSMQDFAHELPLKEYAKVYFGEDLVMPSSLSLSWKKHFLLIALCVYFHISSFIVFSLSQTTFLKYCYKFFFKSLFRPKNDEWQNELWHYTDWVFFERSLKFLFLKLYYKSPKYAKQTFSNSLPLFVLVLEGTNLSVFVQVCLFVRLSVCTSVCLLFVCLFLPYAQL